jgi:copper oxidase (laccase) domain-containing protein
LNDLYVFIGPGICKEHYVFSERPDGYNRFVKIGSDGMFHVDLGTDIVHTLTSAGIMLQNIICDQRCTYESNELFSHRRSRGVIEQRFGCLMNAYG